MNASIVAPETPRVSPEWPEPGLPTIVWKFDGPVTLYEFSIHNETVTDHLEKSISLGFGRHAQHDRSVAIYTPGGSMNREWPEWAWMVLVRGLHPLGRKEIIERKYGATVHSGTERMEIETFERWLSSERLEILVDFRASSIAEGWRPPYAGASGSWPNGWSPQPSLPPLHLAHWYPERTVLTCSPTREDWTENRLSYYLDHECLDIPLDTGPTALVGVEEFWLLVERLEYERRDLMRKQKEAKKKHSHLFRQKGEIGSEWVKRWCAMSRADQDQASELDTRRRQQELFQAIKVLKAGGIPDHGDEGGFLDLIKPLQKLRDEAVETWRQRIRAKAATDFPVDDAAWETEVESRKAEELERQDDLRKFRNVKGGA